MKLVAIGQSYTHRVHTTHAHTADAHGNKGITVVATPVLIGFIETAATECLRPCCEPGEGSVGTTVNVRHLAASLAGSVVDAIATVTAVKGKQVEFKVEAKAGDVLLMDGNHGRAVVNLARFFDRLGIKPPAG